MAYQHYKDIRGRQAEAISRRIGIGEKFTRDDNGHLIEIRKAFNHFRITAHGKDILTEIYIYNDRRLEIINHDDICHEALKTLYFPDGTILSLRAPWNSAKGYLDAYEELSRRESPVDAYNQWEKYDAILMQAEVNIS